jgi:hypothetical protein
MRRYPSGISKTASTPCVKEIPGPDEHPGDAGVEERVLPDGGGAEDERSHGREQRRAAKVYRENWDGCRERWKQHYRLRKNPYSNPRWTFY